MCNVQQSISCVPSPEMLPESDPGPFSSPSQTQELATKFGFLFLNMFNIGEWLGEMVLVLTHWLAKSKYIWKFQQCEMSESQM